MKKKILIRSNGFKDWIGGIYYLRNVLYSILINKNITDNYSLVLLVYDEYKELFTDFEPLGLRIITVKKYHKLREVVECIFNVDYVYFTQGNKLRMFGVKCINWIPDFQHNRLPDFFTDEERNNRTKLYMKICNGTEPLILSSQTAKRDFEEFYGSKSNVYVFPFVSYIEPEINRINEEAIKKTLSKYGVYTHKYVCVCNQFWKHKNHIIIFKALKYLVDNGEIPKYKFVFTGATSDYRNNEYFLELTKFIQDKELQKYIVITGFINRLEQLILMKSSCFILQPSLFEGWGTVVEDAKVLDKRILLSDIDVHREQMNSKCTLFNPMDEQELAYKIQSMEVSDKESINNGLKSMRKSAVEYSKSFEKLLKDME